MKARSLSWSMRLPLTCGNGPAAWMRSSRMYQSPRASSASQPWQCGTLGHFFSAALTMSSMGRIKADGRLLGNAKRYGLGAIVAR
jgi:hypothetical protein